MEMRTETLDNSFLASHPGGMRLSEQKLKRLQPELFSTLQWVLFLLRNPGFLATRRLWKKHIEEHLMWGDSRAAIVISTQPLLIAAYTDELDCVALLRFDTGLVDEYGLKVGFRLLTVNTYSDLEDLYEKDLTPGSGSSGSFGNVHPFVAEFLTDDSSRLEERRAEIDEGEWNRAENLAKEYISKPGAMARDGRPVLSAVPASLPVRAD